MVLTDEGGTTVDRTKRVLYASGQDRGNVCKTRSEHKRSVVLWSVNTKKCLHVRLSLSHTYNTFASGTLTQASIRIDWLPWICVFIESDAAESVIDTKYENEGASSSGR